MLRRLRAALLAALLITTGTATVAEAAVSEVTLTFEPTAWAKVHSANQATPYWMGGGDGPEPKVGYCCDPMNGNYRSYFQYDLNSLRGKQLQQATLIGNQVRSWSCEATTVQLFASGQIHSRTTWADQPPALGLLDQRATNQGSNCTPPGIVELRAIDGVHQAVTNTGILTTLLKAGTEGVHNGYKRFERPPVLRVVFMENRPPDAPSDLRVDEQPCSMVPTEPHTNGEFAELSFVLTDPNHDELRARIEISTWDGRPLDTRHVTVWSGSRVRLPWGPVEPGQTYSWRIVDVTDGRESGPPSGRCDFTAD